MRLPLLSLAVVAVGVAAAGPAAIGGASYCGRPGWRRAWGDEFDSDGVDPRKWTVEDGTSIGACRSAYCTPANVRVRNGTLVLESKRENLNGRNFSTGAVNTKRTATWAPTNGTFRVCVSAKLPGVAGQGQGLWPAHWLMPLPRACDPDLGEMDTLEMVNADGVAHSTYHWQTTFPTDPCAYPKGHKEITQAHTLPSGWNTRFHEFAVERGPSHIAFAVDGVVILERRGTEHTYNATEPPFQGASTSTLEPGAPMFWDVPWYLILNTAVGGPWPGAPNASTVFPVEHVIDYVRVDLEER